MVQFQHEDKFLVFWPMRLFLSLFFLLACLSLSSQNVELAQSYFRKGDYEKAIHLYKPLFESNPIRQDYFKTLLTCYQQIESYGEAQSLLEEQLQRFPNQKNLFVEIGYNYQLQGENDLATGNFRKAIDFVRKNPSFCFVIGRSFSQNHLLDEALEVYHIAKEINPKLNTEISEARIYGEKGDLEKMFSLYLELIEKNENYYTTVQRYVAAFITEDKDNPKNLLFKKLLLKKAQSDPKDSWNILLSWMFMQQHDYDKAFVQEKSLFNRNPGNLERINQIAMLSYSNGDFDTAKEAFRFIIQDKNELVTGSNTKLQAEIYLLKIEQELSDKGIGPEKINKKYLELLDQYSPGTPSPELQLAYAQFLTYGFDQPEQAISRLEKILPRAQSAFEKGMIQMEIADILVYTGQFNQALVLYTQIQYDLKNSTLAQEARFKVARTSYFKGDFQWAQNQLKVLKSSTSQLIANDALELSLKISNNSDKDSLNEGLKKFAKADLLGFQKKYKEAIDTLEIILYQFKGQNIEDDALFKQAQLYSKIGNFTAAENNLLTILDHHQESLFTDDALFNLAQLYEQHLGNPARAKEMYEKIIFDFPSSIYLVPARKAFRKLRGDDL
jgi:tetratricopeptide (TPR) repeat protein